MPYLWHAYYETVFTLLLENGWREACGRHGREIETPAQGYQRSLHTPRGRRVQERDRAAGRREVPPRAAPPQVPHRQRRLLLGLRGHRRRARARARLPRDAALARRRRGARRGGRGGRRGLRRGARPRGARLLRLHARARRCRGVDASFFVDRPAGESISSSIARASSRSRGPAGSSRSPRSSRRAARRPAIRPGINTHPGPRRRASE